MGRIVTSFAFDPELYGLDRNGCEIELEAGKYSVRLVKGDKVKLNAGWSYVSEVEYLEGRGIFWGRVIYQRVYVVKDADWYRMKGKENSMTENTEDKVREELTFLCWVEAVDCEEARKINIPIGRPLLYLSGQGGYANLAEFHENGLDLVRYSGVSVCILKKVAKSPLEGQTDG